MQEDMQCHFARYSLTQTPAYDADRQHVNTTTNATLAVQETASSSPVAAMTQGSWGTCSMQSRCPLHVWLPWKPPSCMLWRVGRATPWLWWTMASWLPVEPMTLGS